VAATAARSSLALSVRSRRRALGRMTCLALLAAALTSTLALAVLRLVTTALLGGRVSKGGRGPREADHRCGRNEQVEFHRVGSFSWDARSDLAWRGWGRVPRGSVAASRNAPPVAAAPERTSTVMVLAFRTRDTAGHQQAQIESRRRR
jgi:hypothetical protein